MCCEPGDMRKGIMTGTAGESCCCGVIPRRFYTAEEKKSCLAEYRDQLEKELAGVREQIQTLEGK